MSPDLGSGRGISCQKKKVLRSQCDKIFTLQSPKHILTHSKHRLTHSQQFRGLNLGKMGLLNDDITDRDSH